MKRQLGIIAFACILSMIGCSNRSSTADVQQATDSGNPVQTPDPTAYQTATTNNSNLWDTTTNTDIPATSPSPSPSPTTTTTNGYPAQWGCLNGGNNYNYPTTTTGSTSSSMPYWYGSNTGSNTSSSLSSACFDDSWGGSFGQDSLYNAGLGAFGSMQACYQTVMSLAPQYCSTGYDVNQVFKMTQMALTRCFRGILRQQMQMAQWSQPQTQAFQQNDQSFYYLLQLFSQGNNGN